MFSQQGKRFSEGDGGTEEIRWEEDVAVLLRGILVNLGLTEGTSGAPALAAGT